MNARYVPHVALAAPSVAVRLGDNLVLRNTSMVADDLSQQRPHYSHI